MSAKYANLPDIDTAQDVYETEDVFPSAHETKGESSDEEGGAPSRAHGRGKAGDPNAREELDATSLTPEDAAKRFRKAEKKRPRARVQYVYPATPDSGSPSRPTSPSQTAVPLSQRLRLLQAEVAALEQELADPSNPLLRKEKEAGHAADPGELIRGMVDVKRRIEKISKAREGRSKLVSVVLGEEGAEGGGVAEQEKGKDGEKDGEKTAEAEAEGKGKAPEVRDIAEMDRRVGELERLIGSSSTALDELTPLPPPLLPLLTRLNAQLTLLTQPRHIDSIARRIKLLNADLDRATSAGTHHPHHAQRKSGSSHPAPAAAAPAPTASASALQEQLAPVLTRLVPLLPHVPHILTRLRTLSALHTSAAGFQRTLEGLEDEQHRVRGALEELARAVEGVEKSLGENEGVVRRNVQELEERVDAVARRLEDVGIDDM